MSPDRIVPMLVFTGTLAVQIMLPPGSAFEGVQAKVVLFVVFMLTYSLGLFIRYACVLVARP